MASYLVMRVKWVVFLLASVVLLTACTNTKDSKDDGNQSSSHKNYEWKMAMTWPLELAGLGTGAKEMAESITKMSNGRLTVKVYGAGELFPPLELFDQVKSGAVEMGHGAAYYWTGKEPAAQFFTSVPFGMTAQQMNAWIYHGGGQQLWDEIYAKHGLKAFPAGNTGVQMGGWFNKEITSVDDIIGLKMRIPGFAGQAFTDAGGSAENISGGELYQALEKGTIDALEWAGPYNDITMGFAEVAKYYYSPGWHEPGSVLELIVNKKAWDSLPEDLQAIVEAAAAQANVKMLAEFEAGNARFLKEVQENPKVSLRQFPPDVLRTFHTSVQEVLQEKSAQSDDFSKVYQAFSDFQRQIREWHTFSEREYNKALSTVDSASNILP
jgi:TRAP-type mannitol/chloroaromatic compound transport system substrate-binding protein